jgi:hypothetical protein
MSISIGYDHDSHQSLDFIDLRPYRECMSLTMSTNPAPSALLGDQLEHLAWAIARDGIERHESALARMLARAAADGADGALIAIAGDRSQPAVARERAFGRLPFPKQSHRAANPRRIAA